MSEDKILSLKEKAISHFQCPKCGSHNIKWKKDMIICLYCGHHDEAKNFEIQLVKLEDAEEALEELKQKMIRATYPLWMYYRTSQGKSVDIDEFKSNIEFCLKSSGG